MNRFKIGLVSIVLLGVLGCVPKPRQEAPSQYSLPQPVGAEVSQTALSTVFDDGNGMVWIKLDRLEKTYGFAQADSTMAEIFRKKELWMKKFPNRKVLSISQTVIGESTYGYTYVTGVILTYEVKE